MSDRGAVAPAPVVLWAIPVADLGGVARHALDAARAGIPGWRLVVLCPEGSLAEKLREQGSAVVTGSFGPSAGVVASVRTLVRVARRLRPAIVHSHLAYADIITAMAPLPAGTRRFTTEHGIAGEDAVYHGSALTSRLMATAHSLRLRRFDGVIAVSEATKRAMIAKWKPRRQIDVIPNGVDLPEGVERRDPSVVPDTLRILSLSRLAPEKRIDVLVDAFALVHAERPDATLTIAGTGPLEAELRAQVDRLGLTEAVSFPGYVDAHEAMDEADVVAQLSVWENCSYTLLDAVARGLRVVVTDVGGNREVVGASMVLGIASADRIRERIVHPPIVTQSRTVDRVDSMCARVRAAYETKETL